MKIDAEVVFNAEVANELACRFDVVPVDLDYVEASESEIYDYVANELEDRFGRIFGRDEFEITNINDILMDAGH